uniref:EF-hand domain-containing protein n=1 Tax=Clytia hemisphaerica TaxID=252671 RepID=A0A7M5XM99_9CNID
MLLKLSLKPLVWITAKKLNSQNSLKDGNDLLPNDLKLWSQNKTTLIRRWGDVVFDIFDKDGSGTISLDEWKAYGRVSGICASDADAEQTFKHCDLDNSGKLDVDEMTRQHLGFWYTLDPQADGLYGNFVP